jgi:hypothetical protein
MKQSQEQFVKNELLKEGKISRNYCLELYKLGVRTNILRLGAIICELIKDGWDIKGENVQTDSGKDFVYRLVGSPYTKKEYFVPELNKTITRYEKT